MSIGGAIFVAMQKPGLQDDVTYEVHTHEERVTIDRFAALDRRLRFAPEIPGMFDHSACLDGSNILGAMAAAKGLTASGLFIGQSPNFFTALTQLAAKADAATRPG